MDGGRRFGSVRLWDSLSARFGSCWLATTRASIPGSTLRRMRIFWLVCRRLREILHTIHPCLGGLFLSAKMCWQSRRATSLSDTWFTSSYLVFYLLEYCARTKFEVERAIRHAAIRGH